MKRIRTVVVDDEQPARTRLLALLGRHADVETVGVARNGREAVTLIRSEQPHLVFLDVQMPGMDGLAVVQEVTPERMPATIFVTAHEQYALDAFDAHALDYLLKPYSDERFESALEHARRFLCTPPPLAVEDTSAREDPDGGRPAYLERLVIRTPGRVTFLAIDEIDWIEAAGVYVYLHTGGRHYLHRSSMANLLQRLDPSRFVRIHRSSAVNTSRVRELQPRSHGDFTLILKDGRELTLSRAYRTQLEQWLRQPL